MTRQTVSLDDRRKKITGIATTEYHSSDDAAMAYLAAIEGASVEEQKLLFQQILTIHGMLPYKKHLCPPKNSIEPGEWRKIGKRINEMVKGWSKAAIRNNASLEETAEMLWDELTLYEGNDRVVALGILLDQAVVPYAQLPPNLTLIKPRDMYDSAHRRIIRQLAQFRRIEKTEGISILEVSVAMTRILEELDAHEERVAFLRNFVEEIAQAHKLIAHLIIRPETK